MGKLKYLRFIPTYNSYVYIYVSSLECRKNYNLMTDNKTFESTAEFEYLGTKAINRSCLHEEIERKLNSANACYH